MPAEDQKTTDQMVIDTGDTVFHRPTGEEWVVAYVQDGRLAWCGWPPGEADVNDCELRTPASNESRIKLLNDLANMQSREDRRCSYARWRLGIRD